jgi:hypothetical protein
MRLFGMVLLALGMMSLIPSGIALSYSRSWQEVLGFLTCVGIISIPMMIGGISIIRQAEDPRSIIPSERGPTSRSHVPARSEHIQLQAGPTRFSDDRITNNPTAPRHPDPGDPLHPLPRRVRVLDLNTLNWIGWLLLLGTFGVALAGAGLAALFHERGTLGGTVEPWVVPGILGLTAGFFFGIRWLLGLFGVSIYRE